MQYALLIIGLIAFAGACSQRDFDGGGPPGSAGIFGPLAEQIRKARVIVAIGMVGVILSILTGAAVAQTAPPAPANPFLAWAADTALQMLTLATPIVLAWFGWKINEWFGIKKDASLRDGFQIALENGAGKMVQAAASAGQTLVLGSIGRNKALAEGLAYVKAAAPDAIEHFKISDNVLIEKLEAKIGLKIADNLKG